MIDPMFSKYGYWTWQIAASTPQIYGVPLSNFVGWFVVALLMLWVFVLLLKYSGKGPIRFVKRENSWDSRIAYMLLLIDAAVANMELGQDYVVVLGVIAMSVFLILTYGSTRTSKEDPRRQPSASRIRDPL
jgi:uncharacterized membrane protein